MGQHGLPVPPLPTTVVVLGGQKSVRPAGSAWIQLYGVTARITLRTGSPCDIHLRPDNHNRCWSRSDDDWSDRCVVDRRRNRVAHGWRVVGNRWWVVGNCGAIGNHDRHRGRPDDNHGVAVAVSRSHRCTQANGKHSQHDDETFQTSLLGSLRILPPSSKMVCVRHFVVKSETATGCLPIMDRSAPARYTS